MSFSHGEVYNPKGCKCAARDRPVPGENCPAVLIAPGHYIQGANIIDSLGRYVHKLIHGCDQVGLFITAGGLDRIGDRVKASFAEVRVACDVQTFGGVCSYEEVDTAVAKWSASGIKAVIAIGGGSCHDCGKLAAYKLKVPMVVVSTLAATDAPCSALSVMYTPEGGVTGLESFPKSPDVVVVDTQIVATAGKRSLVSGYGDALSTYYEARTCFENPMGLSWLEARPTATARSLGSLCKDLLYENALKAVEAVEAKTVDAALEAVVEANTLLSGIGFESGGVAVSHAVAQALSCVKSVHDSHMHGEMVAMGLLTMLTMEEMQGLPGRSEELERVGKFLCEVGLPCCHEQIHFDASNAEDVELLLEIVFGSWVAHNEPFAVTKELVREAWSNMDQKGQDFRAKYGDSAYQSIHSVPVHP